MKLLKNLFSFFLWINQRTLFRQRSVKDTVTNDLTEEEDKREQRQYSECERRKSAQTTNIKFKLKNDPNVDLLFVSFCSAVSVCWKITSCQSEMFPSASHRDVSVLLKAFCALFHRKWKIKCFPIVLSNFFMFCLLLKQSALILFWFSRLKKRWNVMNRHDKRQKTFSLCYLAC